jgi:hypothetical protein
LIACIPGARPLVGGVPRRSTFFADFERFVAFVRFLTLVDFAAPARFVPVRFRMPAKIIQIARRHDPRYDHPTPAPLRRMPGILAGARSKP